MSILSRPYFHSEDKAFEHLESVVWAAGKSCPHCGGVDRITKVKANPEKRIRIGLWRCGDCKRQFTVKVGTVFEHARLPLHKALQAVYLMTTSKKGISAHQLHRMLGVTYKTAWFLAHRIREAMRDGILTPFGSDGGIVEVDETFIGFDPDSPPPPGSGVRTAHKMKVLSLVERNTGRARSYVVDNLKARTIGDILGENLAREAYLMTDDFPVYGMYGDSFAGHGVVKHARKEYVNRLNPTIHTNTIEGYFSIFKRGMKGIYQHCAKKHLHRYAAEFDFRYSHRAATGFDDATRSDQALKGIVGKRLTYRRTNAASA